MRSYRYQRDWFSSTIPEWEETLSCFKGKDHLSFLEIGSFEGRSAVWLLENILTGPTCSLTCIDTWAGSAEHTNVVDLNFDQIEANFDHNIKEAASVTHINKRKGFSYEVLPTLPKYSCDFIYIDGSHRACDVLEDAVLSWRLLKKGGIMIFDDYIWESQYSEIESPKIAVDSFVKCYTDQMDVIRQSLQFTVQKK